MTKNNQEEARNAAISYKEAIEELQTILQKLQSDDCDIDAMVAMTRRASELITLCRSRLTATEEELRAVLESLG